MSSRATLIAEAKAALSPPDAADERELDSRQLSSDARWIAAERLAELYGQGMTQREIGAAVGLHHSTVGLYIKCWEYGAKSPGNTGYVRSQLFGVVMKEIRGGWGNLPSDTAGKAKVAIDYISNPDVWKNPDVQAAAQKAMTAASKERLPPPTITPAKEPPGLMAAQTWARTDYWMKLTAQIEVCQRAIAEAIVELERSGVPDGGAKLIKGLRLLRRTVEKAERVMSETAVGQAG